MVKCLICGKEFENGFGPEICPECRTDKQTESRQSVIPEEHKKHYKGSFGECNYDSRIFVVCKSHNDSEDITFLHYKEDCGLFPYVPEGYTSCYGMFKDCKLPKGFTLGNNFDTSNVTDMRAMFSYCELPKGFTLGDNFDTSKVRNMSYMFYGCKLSEDFALGDKFDISNVIDMTCMFYECSLPEDFTSVINAVLKQ